MPDFEDDTVKSEFQSARSTETFTTGQILATKYKVIALLGSGGMGTVYSVHQIFLNIELALKVLDGKQHLNDSQMRRFTLEARAAYSLNHPSLVKVHDFGLLESGQPYLVMDLVAGKTLADYLKEFGAMALEPACEVFVQAAEGLYYAHQQSVIHRDVKPSNIMLLTGVSPGTPGSVKIVDFGIAKIVGEDIGEVQALTRTGEIFGSPFYMSPEQCSGELVDHRTDIYSLGCAFFETLTGTPPHVGINALRTMMLHKTESAPKLRDASLGVDFPESLELIIQQMLAKSPHERYENLKVAAREIAEVVRSDREQSSDTTWKPKFAQSSTAKKSSAREQIRSKQKIVKSSISLGILAIATAAATILFKATEKSNQQNESLKVASLESDAARKAKIREESPILQASNGINNKSFEMREKSRIAFSRAVPITQVLITEDGIKKRLINFPQVAIGRIEYEHNAKKIEARGNIKVPADGHLQLLMGGDFPFAFQNPTVIKKIAPNIFDGLAIEHPDTFLDSDSTDTDRESQNIKYITEILASASKWTKLKELIFNSIVLDKSAAQEIAKFSHLEELQILNIRGSELELADQPFLRKLSYLRLNKVSSADILKTIGGSTAIKNLHLDNNDLAENDFKEISKCPNIDSLTIASDKITDNEINELVHMKRLRSVSLINVPVVSRQVQNLLKSSSLKSVSLIGTSKRCLLANPIEDPRLKTDNRSE
jgi:serine/threonine protein kinase